MRFHWIDLIDGAAALATLCLQTGAAQQKNASKTNATVEGDWPLYRHDFAGTGYSPLAHITAQNAGTLTQAWNYRLTLDAPLTTKGKGKGGAGGNSEATPIMANDIVYVPAANRVVALQPESGKEIWAYPVTGGAPSRPGGCILAGQQQQSSTHSLHGRTQAHRLEREHGQSRSGVWQGRRSGYGGAV